MLRPIPVNLAPYNFDWAKNGAHHADRLRVLGPALVGVYHIGSTAVPGIAAKPVIDLMPLVTDLAELDQRRGCVESLGYGWHGEYGISGRRYCTLSDDHDNRIVQLHFFKSDSPHAVRHLAFRDYLRSHPEIARAYEAEKRRARELHPDDSHAYSDEKSAWIRIAETKALRWFAEIHPGLGSGSVADANISLF
jgi:GrpB-like predicted nucleotidyltransferase (UPF0157 family)